MRLYQNLDQAMRALGAKDAEIERLQSECKSFREMIGEIDRQHAAEIERLNAELSSRAQEIGRLVEDRDHWKYIVRVECRDENERLRVALHDIARMGGYAAGIAGALIAKVEGKE